MPVRYLTHRHTLKSKWVSIARFPNHKSLWREHGQYQHDRCPTNGPDGKKKAAAFAGELARATNARGIVITVQDEQEIIQDAWGTGESPSAIPYAEMSVEDIRNMLDERVRKIELLDTVTAQGKLDPEPETVVEWGHPVGEICRIADERDADLIVSEARF